VNITGNQLIGSRIRITEGQDMTISGNTIVNSSSNGVQLDSASRNVNITGNTVIGAGLGGVRFSAFDYPADGPSENVSVTGNTLTGGAYGVLVNDSGGDPAFNGQLEVHFNRIAGNTTNGLALNDNADVNATNNWWGCNAGPGSAGCDTVGGDFAGQVDSAPWLLMVVTAAPSTVYQTTGQSTVTADFTINSNFAVVGSGFPDSTPVVFTTSTGTITPLGFTDGGRAGALFTAPATTGTASVHALLDGETASGATNLAAIKIVHAPAGPPGPQGTPGASGAVQGVTAKSCKKGKKFNKKTGKCVKKKKK
jgi:hypothetical protein